MENVRVGDIVYCDVDFNDRHNRRVYGRVLDPDCKYGVLVYWFDDKEECGTGKETIKRFNLSELWNPQVEISGHLI